MRTGRPSVAVGVLMDRILRRLIIPVASRSTRAELAAALDVTPAQVRVALAKLRERGQVVSSIGSRRDTYYSRPDYAAVRDQSPAPDDASRPNVGPADAPVIPGVIVPADPAAPLPEPANGCAGCGVYRNQLAFARRQLSDAQRDAARYHEMLVAAEIPVMPLATDNPASPNYRARTLQLAAPPAPDPLAAAVAQIFAAPAVPEPPPPDVDMSEHVVLVPGYVPTLADADAWADSRAERLAADNRAPDGYCLGCDQKVGHPEWCPYAPADLRVAGDPADW